MPALKLTLSGYWRRAPARRAKGGSRRWGAPVIGQIAALWSANKPDAAPTITKWERIYTAAGRRLRKTDSAVVAADLLCKLRNFFAHGRPDTFPVRDRFAEELARELPSYFAFNPGQQDFIAHAVLSPDCAAWAFDTACNFSQHVSDGLGITNAFSKTLSKPHT
jgi:hypothetical protein